MPRSRRPTQCTRRPGRHAARPGGNPLWYRAAVALCLAAAVHAWGTPVEKPNIVFILADDLGYGDLGVYNQADRCARGLPCIRTPRLDRMASEGMLFTNMYAGAPVCQPSRCVLMTGFHTGHATVRRNGAGDGRYVPLRPEDITVAEVLKRAGYAAALIGKWGLGGADAQHNRVDVWSSPENKGFDLGYGFLAPLHNWNPFPRVLWRNGVLEWYPQNDGPLDTCAPKVTTAQELLTNEALAFIEAHADEPFYLQLSYTIPHKYNIAADLSGYPDATWPPIERNFAAQVSHLDDDVGRILDRLVELGIERRTLVIFTSDNGPQQATTLDCGQHDAEFFDSNAHLRGVKGSLNEGGIRVPFLAWWPGVIPAGAHSDHLAAFEDFLPTAAELAGVPAPPGIDGASYAPVLTGQGAPPVRPYYYWEWNGEWAVRAGRYKLLWHRTRPHLYDLEQDPSERNDLARDPNHADEIARLTAYRVQAHRGGPPPVSDPVVALAGDVSASAGTYVLDFGTVPLGSAPVTRTFAVRNDATTYCHLLEGTVQFALSDARLAAADSEYAWLVGGGQSEPIRVTLTPIRLGPLTDQSAVVLGRAHVYETPAVNSPITLRLTGRVVPNACAGDLDGDFDADLDDLTILLQELASGGPAGDANADGTTDTRDLVVLLESFGTRCR